MIGRGFAIAAIAAAVLVGYSLFYRPKGDSLSVYCAHDAVHAQSVLRRFYDETGIQVSVRFDTEANKSLALVELLRRERSDRRCDVFWNNQLLGTAQLASEGLFEAYRGAGYDRIPAKYRCPAGYWTGFGGRLRVFTVNTTKMEATDAAIETALAGRLDDVAIAKPQFGTTLSHYAVRWGLDGADALRGWHHDVRRRGIREVPGNATVQSLVASGSCALGYTDSDDFLRAKATGAPVAMVPIRTGDGRAIVIPNTVAIVKGTTRRPAAERLVEFLLSAETERRLAGSAAGQIPLGPIDERPLPEAVARMRAEVPNSVELNDFVEARKACLDWLKAGAKP